jgi:hypothetical protein
MTTCTYGRVSMNGWKRTAAQTDDQEEGPDLGTSSRNLSSTASP